MALLLGLLGSGCQPPPPVSHRGVLDLRSVDFSQPVRLHGTWLAQANADSVVFSDFGYDDRHWQPVQLPGYFRHHGLPEEGLVWYRLRLHLPPGLPSLAAYVQHANNAHQVFVARPGEEGVALGGSGLPSRLAMVAEPSRRSTRFRVPTDRVVVLSWKISNHGYPNGGPLYPLYLGTPEAIATTLSWRSGLTFFSFGIFFILGVLCLAYWAWRRPEKGALVIGLLALVMALGTLAVTGMLETLFPQTITFDRRLWIEACCFLLVPGLLLWLLWVLFPWEFAPVRLGRWHIHPRSEPANPDPSPLRPLLPQPLRLANTALVLLGTTGSLLLTLTALFGPASILGALMRAGQWLGLILALPMLAIAAQAAERRRPLAGAVFPGLVLLVLAGVHDILLGLGYLRGHVYWLVYAFLCFVVINGIAVARRNARLASLAEAHQQHLGTAVQQETKALRAKLIAAHATHLSKQQLLHVVSHEFRTPLASIQGYAELLEEEIASPQPQHREFLRMIKGNTRRLLALLDDLMDMASLESGKVTVTLAPVAVAPVLREVQHLLFPLAKDQHLTLAVLDEAEGAHVLADRQRLQQVLVNLGANAIKFTEVGGLTLRAYPAQLDDRPAFALAVEDTGPGISEAFMPHLFEAFSQEAPFPSSPRKGIGLGLAISRELTRRMGGQITVETTAGLGSTFTVLLPAAATDDEESGETAGQAG